MFHRYVSTDGDVMCLTCGSAYYTDDNGDATTNSGDSPQTCTFDTDKVHGYSGERFCVPCDAMPGETCEHMTECDCALCN